MVFRQQYINTKNNVVELFANTEHNTVLVIGVFHGDEPQGNFLINEYIKINPETRLLFIPCLNPDGMKKNERANANGVDLNRNFPTKNWEKSLKQDNFYSGSSPASEVETQFLIKIIEQYKPNLILTLHAPYKIVNYDGDAKNIAEKISEIISYPVQHDIGYPTPGSFGTWAGIEKNIPVITLELDEKRPQEELKAPVFKIFNMLEKM